MLRCRLVALDVFSTLNTPVLLTRRVWLTVGGWARVSYFLQNTHDLRASISLWHAPFVISGMLAWTQAPYAAI